MFKDEADLKKIVKRLNIDAEPNPAHRENLRRKMLTTFKAEQTTTRTIVFRTFRRTIMKSPIVKLSAVAGIIIAVFLIHQLGGSIDGTTAALARAIKNTKKMPWMHVMNERYYGEKEKRIEQRWYHFASRKQFLLASNGAVWCWDKSDAQKQYAYDPSTHTLTITNLPQEGFHGSDSAFSMLESLLANWDKQNTTIEERIDRFEGQNVKIYEVKETLPDNAMSIGSTVVAKITYTLVADIDTSLIIAGRIVHLDENNNILARTEQQINYPDTGPNDIYALGVPRTVNITDKTGSILQH